LVSSFGATKRKNKGDGIHCENEENANLGYVYIESGSIKIKCGGDISKGKRKQLIQSIHGKTSNKFHAIIFHIFSLKSMLFAIFTEKNLTIDIFSKKC
jgi:hypothetical protein